MRLLACLSAILVLALPFTSRAQDTVTPEHRKEITKMLKLSGVEDMMKPMIGQMLQAFKGEATGLPSDFWTRMEKKFDTSILLEKLMPVYAKHYTVEDLKTLNAFYETPTGKKMVASLPLIMQESMQIGQEWGRKAGEELAAEIKAEQSAKGK